MGANDNSGQQAVRVRIVVRVRLWVRRMLYRSNKTEERCFTMKTMLDNLKMAAMVAGVVAQHHRFVYDNYLCVQKVDALTNNAQLNLFLGIRPNPSPRARSSPLEAVTASSSIPAMAIRMCRT